MNDIYPMWVRAHGIMLITPVNWYSPTSPLKLMMDRLVCADGGNPDPTSTHGKDAKKAKQLELDDWPYPRHLEGARCSRSSFMAMSKAPRTSVAALADWLRFMKLKPAGPTAELDRYIGYWKPYATSHDELDADSDIQEEVRNAARTSASGGSGAALWQADRRGRRARPGPPEVSGLVRPPLPAYMARTSCSPAKAGAQAALPRRFLVRAGPGLRRGTRCEWLTTISTSW